MTEITAIPHHPGIASSSTASCSASLTPYVHYDIFVNHSADETGDFAKELSKRLVGRGLYVFLDGIDKEVTPRVEAAISLASLQIAIFSENYVSCKWCMDTLVQMTKSEAPILPVFYQVEPSHLRYTGQGGKGPYAQWLRAHEGSYPLQTMQAWRKALEHVSYRKGFELKKRNGGEEELLCRDKEELLCKIEKNAQSVVSMMKDRFYHVFICHRGETKKFAERLYSSLLYSRLRRLPELRVFLDKPELVEAYRIEPQIEAAIQFASINIVIFSPKFPESSWCLDELLLMQTYGAKILPVFYGVKPSDLDGFYNETLLSHLKKRRQNIETIKRWRGALANVPKSDDLMLAGNKEENEEALMNKIVESVSKYIQEPSAVFRQSSEVQRAVESILDEDDSKHIKVRPSTPVQEYYFGLTEKLDAFKKWVLSQQEKVVGILGAAGIGKTTMAKEFCKISKFKESSVLFNLREGALKDLEGKVIEDFKHSPNIGVEGVKQHLPSCDALAESVKQHLPSCDDLAVILDEVDHVDQLDALLPIKNVLSPESLILVTSSAKDVLNMSKISDSSIYHLAGLNREDSRKLLLSYAFDLPYSQLPSLHHLLRLNIQDFQNLLLSYHLDSPFSQHPSDPGFESLVEKFVMACDGLPLPLKELGERLSGKHRSGWEEQLNQLRHNCIPPLEIEHKLNICYDSLNEVEQQIFLDVACFFIGEDKHSATRIFGMEGLKKLENRCLLQMTSKIEMNEVLRNYGRNKAKELNKAEELNKAKGLPRRRLWHQEETKQINDLLEKSSSELAQFRGITMNGDPGDETEMPRSKPSGETFSGSGNLKFLAAQGGYVDKILTRVGSADLLWLKWHKCTHSSLPSWFYMKKLRVLEVEGSKLTELWQTKSQAPLQLRELNICAPLSLFPESIGQLELLEKIVVKYSEPLPFKVLPEEFCRLRSLKYLEMTECSGMMSLPNSFGDLANLQYLDLKGASRLKMLPKSFGNLTLLKYLFLEGCSEIRMLPGLEHFTSLETLDVRECKNLDSIPELRQLKKLQILDVSGCSQIKSLSGLEHLNSLETFIVSGCQKLQSIPGLGHLTKLPELDVSGCSEIKLLPGLEKLTSLESFNVSGCQKLQSIGGLEQLTKLQTLDVSGCKKLQSIDVSGSRWIHTLSGLEHLTSLKKLNASGCKKLQRLPSLGLLKKLMTIDVSGCCEIQSLLGLGQLSKLQILNVSRCYEIRELPGVELLTSLKKLNVSQCWNLKSIPELGQLTKLQILNVSGCYMIGRLPGMERLTSLKTLNVSQSGMERLTSLKTLNVSQCRYLESIPELGKLTKLQILNVSGYYKIERLPGVERLTSLKTLNVSECCNLKSIPELGKLTKLQILNVSRFYNIERLPGVERLTSLKTLNVSECGKLKRMPELGQLTKLQTLDAGSCDKMQSLLGLENLTSLKTLNIRGCNELHSIPRLAQLKMLQILHVGWKKLQRMPSLEHFTSLLTLDITGCRLESIPTLGSLSKLRNLKLSELSNLRELPSLEHLTSLKKLSVCECQKLESMPGLGSLTKLRNLKLSLLTSLRELPSLEHLTSLEKLSVKECQKLESMPGLGSLTKLRNLKLSLLTSLRELPSLEHLTSLQSLLVFTCQSLQSIPSLEHLTNVKTLMVACCGDINSLQGLEHLISLKKLLVCGCKKLKSMPGLGHLTKLETLDVIGCQQIFKFRPRGYRDFLDQLNSGDVCMVGHSIRETEGGIQTLQGLESLISLKSLDVRDCEELESISPLRFLQKLKSLHVRGCPKIQDLPGVEHLISLESLDVRDCKELQSIPPLRFLQKLKSLNVWGCPKIQDLPGVEYAMSLKYLSVHSCPGFRLGREVLEQLRQRKTDLYGDAKDWPIW